MGQYETVYAVIAILSLNSTCHHSSVFCHLLSIYLYLHSLHGRDLIIQGQDVWQGADGRNGGRVDLRMRARVVVLDVQEVGRVLESRVVPVQVAHPLVEVRVPRADVTDVALEVLDVDGLCFGGRERARISREHQEDVFRGGKGGVGEGGRVLGLHRNE